MHRYRSTFNRITRHKLFINISTAIILLYSVVLGIKTFESVAIPYERFLTVLDGVISIYFVAEIALRLLSYRRFWLFFRNGWNIFDFTIVAITMIPVGHTEFAMVMRVLRVFRILRLITIRPQLKELIDVLLKAIPAFVDILVLLFIIFYIYAIIGVSLFNDTPSGLWDNFSIAMLTLFRVFTLEDWTDVMYETMEVVSPWSWLYFVSFLVIAAFVFFNLFVAVLVEEISAYRQAKLQHALDEDHAHIMHMEKIVERLEKKIDAVLENQQHPPPQD